MTDYMPGMFSHNEFDGDESPQAPLPIMDNASMFPLTLDLPISPLSASKDESIRAKDPHASVPIFPLTMGQGQSLTTANAQPGSNQQEIWSAPFTQQRTNSQEIWSAPFTQQRTNSQEKGSRPDKQPDPDVQAMWLASSLPHLGQPGIFAPGQPSTMFNKRRLAFLFVLVILASLLIGGGTVFAFTSLQAGRMPAQPQTRLPLTTQQVPAPNSTLQTYCQAVKAGNAQAIYDLLSQQAKIHTSLDDLQRAFNALNSVNALGIQYSACNYGNIHVSGSLAVAIISLTVSMTFEGQRVSNSNPSLISLVLENHQWKVDFSSLTQQLVTPPTPTPGVPTPTAASN